MEAGNRSGSRGGGVTWSGDPTGPISTSSLTSPESARAVARTDVALAEAAAAIRLHGGHIGDVRVRASWRAPRTAHVRRRSHDVHLIDLPRDFGALGARSEARPATRHRSSPTKPAACITGGMPELAIAIPGDDTASGAYSSSPPRAAPIRQRATGTSSGRSPDRSVRSSVPAGPPTRSRTTSTEPTPSAESPATSAAASTSIRSCRAWSTTPWSCSRVIAAAVFLRHANGSAIAEVTRGLSPELSPVRPWLPGPIAAGDGRRGPPTAVRLRLSQRPARHRRPRRGRPGGIRHDLRGATARRPEILLAC